MVKLPVPENKSQDGEGVPVGCAGVWGRVGGTGQETYGDVQAEAEHQERKRRCRAGGAVPQC